MKDKLLKLLQENDEYLSGEAISQEFNVSRTAVWKQINSLRKEGYEIESVTNRGYKLVHNSTGINSAGISAAIKTNSLGHKIICLNEVGSTNDYAKKIASEGAENGTLIIAEQQNSGRGRLGRNWSSSKGKGIWMSIILKPNIEPQKAQIITLASSIAVVKALRPLLSDRVKVKWPNDVLVDGKKICGILTEMNCELENINYLVVGMGINVNHVIVDFPEMLRDTATSINIELGGQQKIERTPIIADVLNAFEELYLLILEGKTDKVIYDWRCMSATLGKKVKFKYQNEELSGIAEDITDEGVLLVRDSSDKIHRIFYGEII